MDDMLETYQLETIEQMRAIADELRLRIVEQLIYQAMTVTQLADLLGEVPSRLHYHVRELEKVGLLKLVETREKGGILEKYYRAVAKNITVPGTLFRGMPPDQAIVALSEMLQPFFEGVIRAAEHLLRTQAWDDPDQVLQFSPEHFWMTAEEFTQLSEQINDLLKPYKERRGIEREREQAIMWIGYTVPPATGQADEAHAPTTPEAPALPAPPVAPAPAKPVKPVKSAKPLKHELIFVAGKLRYARKDLQETIAKGEALDIYILGPCTFANDVTPDLVDQAIASFHHWGKLSASAEVREALKRKEVKPDTPEK